MSWAPGVGLPKPGRHASTSQAQIHKIESTLSLLPTIPRQLVLDFAEPQAPLSVTLDALGLAKKSHSGKHPSRFGSHPACWARTEEDVVPVKVVKRVDGNKTSTDGFDPDANYQMVPLGSTREMFVESGEFRAYVPIFTS